MFKGKRILVVEDEGTIRLLCTAVLRKLNATVECASTLQQATFKLDAESFDLLIIDLSLPDGDGLRLVEQYAGQPHVPVLIMTGRYLPEQRVTGFRAGAADYLVKPFLPGELEHRVGALLLRNNRAVSLEESIVPFGDWRMNLTTRTLASSEGAAVELTSGEFDLLEVLALADGAVVARNMLLDAVTQSDNLGHPRTVDVLISRLRKKLEPDPGDAQYILTVRRHGYRLAVET